MHLLLVPNNRFLFLGNYYDLYNIQRGKLWGFCSIDCYLSADNEDGVLRVVDRVDVLSDKICEEVIHSLSRDAFNKLSTVN